MTSYLLFLCTIAGIYALLSLGLVTIWGQGGMVNLGLVGFFALGAYSSALLVRAGMPMGAAWTTAALVSGVVGVCLTFVTRKMRGDYLAIVSLGFAEVIRLVATNEVWLTNGTDGLSGVRAPFKAELGEAFGTSYAAGIWLLVLVIAAIMSGSLRSPFGRALRAVRDDENVAGVAGKPVLSFKLRAFFIGSAISGLAGAAYAHFTSYIAPDAFVPLLTIYIFLAATAGGYTRIAGALVGAAFLVALLETARFAAALVPALNAVQVASLREMAIAVVLIILMRWRPQGLLAEKNQRAPKPKAPFIRRVTP